MTVSVGKKEGIYIGMYIVSEQNEKQTENDTASKGQFGFLQSPLKDHKH